MKVLLGFRIETETHGNDISWSHSNNQIVDIIIKGNEKLIRDYVRQEKANIKESEEVAKLIEEIEEGYSNESETVYDALVEKYDSLTTLAKYKTLLMVDGEFL